MRLPSILPINLLLAAGIACFGGVGLVAYLSVTELADTAREETRIQRTVTSALQVLAAFHDMEARHRRYLISGDREDWVQYRDMQERLAIEAYHLKALLVDNPPQRTNADLLAGDLRLRAQGLELATSRYAAEGREAAFEVLLDPGYQDAGNRVRASVREMVRAQEGVLRKRRAETDAHFRHAAGFSAGAAFTALALMAWSLVVIARYRSEREAVEAELRSAKERLELALEGSGLALWDADVPSGRVYLDERWMEMLGGPRGETRTSVGELLEMVHPDDREQLRQVAREIGEGRREEYRVEHRVLTRSRGWRWILSRGRVVERDAAGRARRMAGVNADVTERRRMDEALRASEEQLRLVMDNVPAMIAYLDDNELCRFANRNYAALFGRAVPEVVGQPLRIIAGRETYPAIEPYVRRALSGETVRHERIHRGPEREQELEVVLVPHAAPGGQVRGLYVMISDITERRAAERMKGEFISVVSHELRTPLTSLSGALELLKGGVAGPLPVEAAPLLDIAARNAERLTGLVNDILDLEKIEAGMMRFEPRAVDLAELLRQALEANRTYALQFGVELELAPIAAGARVNADPDRIMQVLANLLSNAAKFSPEGGRVKVAAGLREGWARVSVRDHGPGLAPEFRKRLFQKFAQQDTSDTARRGGTGLGLAISKAMVERSGGRIGYEPAPDGGSVFWFELPEV